MTKLEMTELIMAAKNTKDVSWSEIATAAGMSDVFVTSCCLGMNTLPAEAAEKLCNFLGLDNELCSALQVYPKKEWAPTVPTDPLIYRFYEANGVYGDTLKELIHEKFGDGIMSAIDFTLTVDKREDPKGDRVVVTFDGKFLPYNQW